MNKITFKGSEFEIIVIDNSITLQSLERDLVFENGYGEVCAQLEKEWTRQGGYGNLSNYIVEYESEAIVDYVRLNESRALEIVWNNN